MVWAESSRFIQSSMRSINVGRQYNKMTDAVQVFFSLRQPCYDRYFDVLELETSHRHLKPRQIMAVAPENAVMPAIKHSKEQPNETVTSYTKSHETDEIAQAERRTSVMNVIVSGMALFSDGYNAQISK